ncbi:hypothetical protein U27_04286 [Candidatus Vecturithrix granuli]|uniref:Uncharacterized protein n=1 Tax=Vecturithrix granuli TaxID=1499967 RepID=A0A081BYB6_VECG1|nr:hypothetical protein U27_04286 [Candidatus Vecturithrix granuli]
MFNLKQAQTLGTDTMPISFELPADVFLSTSVSMDQLVQEMRETLAFKLFSEGRLSGGKAAKLAGMSRIAFLLRAGQLQIDWLSYNPVEMRRELA